MGYFRGSFWWIGILALAGCVPREALLTLLLRGEILRQIFDFSGIVGLGVCEKSQIRHSLLVFFEVFLFALEVDLFHMVPLTSERLFLADGRVLEQSAWFVLHMWGRRAEQSVASTELFIVEI